MSPEETALSENHVDVVIVNYNSGEILEQCLHCLQDTVVDGLNIIIVDNGSADGSLNRVRSKFNQIHTITNNQNLGFATACNQGSKAGQAKAIAFVNPDCFIRSHQLLKLAKTLGNNSNCCLVGCRVLNKDGSLQRASRRRLPTFWRVFFHMSNLAKLKFIKGININDSGIFDQPKPVEAVNGACFLVSREEFDAVGGFDEQYPLHFEDLDLFKRLSDLKKTLLYDSSVEVKHLHGHAKQDSNKVKAWKRQGLLRYFRKHRPSWEAKVIGWLMRINSALS